jgi:hypothetical protein
MKKLPFLLLSSFLLVACGPLLVFGVPQQQWDQLTEQQRNDVIAAYNQRKQWDQFTQQQRNEVIAGYNQRRTAEALEAPVTTNIPTKNSPHPLRKNKKPTAKKSSATNTFSSKHLLASSIIGSLKRMIID